MFNFLHTFAFLSVQLTSMMRSEQCPASHQRLQGPHGPDRLCIPDGPPELRAFLGRVMEYRDFQEAKSEREQVHIIRRCGEHSLPNGISMRQIGNFMGIDKATVQYHLSRPYDAMDGCPEVRLGRPALLNEEQERALVRFVEERFAARDPSSLKM